MRYLLLLVLMPSVLYTPAIAQKSEIELTERADSLYRNFEEKEALSAYQNILARDSSHYRAAWRAGFLYVRIGYRFKEEAQKKEYYTKARQLARLALEIDSSNTHSNLVMAVATGRIAMISGARERIAASRTVRYYAGRAIKLDSTNAAAWHVLGLWHYEVANLGFFERLAANTLFGGVPENAVNEKAIEALKRAADLEPRYVLYHHDLAMIYNETGEQQKAIEACRTALKKESLTPDDPMLKEECRSWIKEWK